MAAETLSLPREQRFAGRVQRYQLGLGGELMAGVAVQVLLVRESTHCLPLESCGHLPQPNLHLFGQVAAFLGAGGVGRLKAVGRAGMAGQTLHVAERSGVGLEMDPVAGG
jgi:hypothetical protein